MAIEHDLDSVIAKAVRDAGSQSAFGRLVGRRQSTVREWLLAGRVPAEAVLAVEAATGVSKYDLRPDLFQREARAPGSASVGAIEAAR